VEGGLPSDAYIPAMSKTPSFVIARLRRRVPVLVCRKCLKRAPNGHDLKRALKGELKRRSRAQCNVKLRLVTTSCFGLCPKRAIVAASGATLQRGEMLVIGDAAMIEAAAAVLLPVDGSVHNPH
jgi:predicted metal-binding protein